MMAAMSMALAAVGAAAALCVLRLVRSGSLVDRAVALDTLLVVVVSGVAIGSAITADGTYLDVVVVTALLGFVGAVLVARFIEERGA